MPVDTKRKRLRPIPLHIECKGTEGNLRPAQKVQRDRIIRSGSLYLLMDRPHQLHELFLKYGLDRIEMQFPLFEREFKVYTEKEVMKFVRDYLKVAQALYDVYFERNQQGMGCTPGRPDWYCEIPRWKVNKKAEA